MPERVKILLVDDDEDFIEISRTILETRYDVVPAYSAKDALLLLETAVFDLVIVDLMMEERDSGFMVAYAIRNNPKLEKLPVILVTSAVAITGFSFNLERDQEWMKVDDFIEKPVKSATFFERIEKLLATVNKDESLV